MLRDGGRDGVPGGEEQFLVTCCGIWQVSEPQPLICQVGTTKVPPRVGGGPWEMTGMQEEGSQEASSFAGCGEGPGDAQLTVQYPHPCQQGMQRKNHA